MSSPQADRSSDPRCRRAGTGRRRGLRIAIQTTAFAGGLAMLWWCARQALAAENRAQIESLREASVVNVVLIGSLSLASIVLNGLVFWAMVAPVRRLSAIGLVATNALASFLNYLPFKASILARVLIHTRRDRVALLTIGAWFAAMGVVLVLTYTPLVGVSLWRRAIDWVWVVVGGGGVVVLLAGVVLVARMLSGETGLARIESVARRLMPRAFAPLATRVLRSGVVAKLHAGTDMLGSPRAVAMCAAFWLGDLVVQATRFVVAAHVLGVDLSFQDAVLVASCYFLIGVASPAGQLGTREAGTTWLAGVLALAGGENLAVVMLLASAVESLVSLAAAGAALVWLRPDRLLWGRPAPPAGSTDPS